jgi:hypothetical protein
VHRDPAADLFERSTLTGIANSCHPRKTFRKIIGQLQKMRLRCGRQKRAFNEELILSRLIAFAFSRSLGHFRTRESQQIAACSISSSGTSRTGLIRAVPLSEGPQSAASSVIARRER